MKIPPALPLDCNQIAATVIVEGHMQGLMDVADPMPKTFEEPKLIAHIEAQCKVPRVIQDCRDNAAIGNRAGMLKRRPPVAFLLAPYPFL